MAPALITSDAHDDVSAVSTPLTIDQLIRLRAEKIGDTPLIAYPTTGLEYKNYSARQLDLFSARVAKFFSKSITTRGSSSEPEKVVAILAASNFDYLITTIALSKLGFTVLFLSTRISDAAYASLLEVTGCTDVVIQPAFEAALSRVKASSLPDLVTHIMPERSFYEYPLTETHPAFSTTFDAHLDPAVETNNICWIIHSSGSTGLPKPIRQTHAAALRNYSNNFNMKGFITLPLFHAHGISSVFRAIHSGKQIHIYNADLPLTSPYLVESMKKNPPEIFYGVPYALKLLAESREGMETLKKCRLVMFGGSSCPDILGDRLVKNGVKLVSHYGTTETGQLMTSFREDGDYDWNFLKVPPNLKPFVRWDQQGGDVYELVILDGWPSKVATNRPDGSYATKDLFQKHATKEDRWKYFGRLDDTLVLVNGEKANPIPTEHTVRENQYVSEAVVFGAGKQQLGSIVILSDNSMGMLEQEVMEKVWPSFEAANILAPEYAHISQDMVRFLPPSTPFPRTDKGTVIRAAFYNMFKADIEEIYADLERGAAGGGLELPEAEIKDFVRKTVLDVLRIPDAGLLKDDTDFFSMGMDSLMAARIRSMILKTLNTGGQTLGLNIVFEKPSVDQLSKFLFRLRVPEESVEKEEIVEETMRRLIEKYSEFPTHVPGDSNIEGEHVVVTGATGSLGAHIVAQLVAIESVKTVFCLVRADSLENAWKRTVQSLQTRRVYHHLSLEQRKKITCLPSDLGKEDLGLSSERYQELKDKVTTVIHSAWSVNFNMDVKSFELQHIKGAHNLISLCLHSNRPSPAGFNFLSSVSSVAATVGSQVPESIETYLPSAQPMGYARSKLITENICNLAAKKALMSSRVHRVGQVVGDTENGIWNATEAIPLLIQGALSTGALPALEDTPTWLPVNIVAKVVLELAFVPPADAPLNALFHVVNPNTIHWTKDLLPALKEAGLDFDIVGKRDWIKRLRESDPDPVRNPTFKLVDFFAKKYDNDKVGKGLYYRTELARSLSPTLRNIGVVDTQLVAKFLGFWTKNCWGVLPTTTFVTTKIIVVTGSSGENVRKIGEALDLSVIAQGEHGLEAVKARALLELTKGSGVILGLDDCWREQRDSIRVLESFVDGLEVWFVVHDAVGDKDIGKNEAKVVPISGGDDLVSVVSDIFKF